MADAPIGISFIPTAENQAQGPRQGGLETDLGQAFKILSLRLPRLLGAQAPAPPSLLNGAGAAGLSGQQGGFNPHAAVFEALIRALTGGTPSGDLYGANTSAAAMAGGVDPHVSFPIDRTNKGPIIQDPGPVDLPGTGWPEVPPGTFHPGTVDRTQTPDVPAPAPSGRTGTPIGQSVPRPTGRSSNPRLGGMGY